MRYLTYTMLVIITTFSLGCFANINPLPDKPYLAVTGSAQVEVQPDQVLIQFKATAMQDTVEAAKQKVDLQVAALLLNLEKAGFEQSVLERGNISTREQYQYVQNQRTLQGISAARDLTYLLTDLSKVNQFLESVTAANINAIQQMHYGLQSPQQWLLKARQLAVQDSLEKAASLASAYQAKLDKIYSINYQQQHAQPIMMRAMSEKPGENSYQVNKIKISDQVQAVFTLE
ncbi:SIMPL domain-containing protein [Psychromonas sp.]|uniref:SIMPL domain-containing protein n=1 Tax=Psychromonas sp. TaxID=1884585 RepID=UPI00356453D8